LDPIGRYRALPIGPFRDQYRALFWALSNQVRCRIALSVGMPASTGPAGPRIHPVSQLHPASQPPRVTAVPRPQRENRAAHKRKIGQPNRVQNRALYRAL
jgi:hypothetical protein